jgi:hypothetical protein
VNPRVVRALVAGAEVAYVSDRKVSLEDVYLKVIGGHMSTLATADRGVVRAVCFREWRESLDNRLLVGMTVLPPLVILIAGIGRSP